ncbi:DUF4240 domain-containing protein [Catellatospora sp. NPDC049111]|uniref:DUF4240 domain-containing protein n=1 Tax=Catellatospora sp. NPDC049111 TaxID=3155271 RepID=UPI0033EAAA43
MAEFDQTERKTPTAADETRFWRLLEQAWAHLDDKVNETRRSLASRPEHGDTDAALMAVDRALDHFLEGLTAICRDMSATELTDLDRVLERKLYDIDRADIQAVTDGSDDGFLYARGFIVALGQDYYTAVVGNPRLAILDCDCESMCYFFAHLHHAKYGGYPDTASGISRESCSNPAGWAFA